MLSILALCLSGVAQLVPSIKPGNTIIMMNISYETTDQDVKRLLDQFGNCRVFMMYLLEGMYHVNHLHLFATAPSCLVSHSLSAVNTVRPCTW